MEKLSLDCIRGYKMEKEELIKLIDVLNNRELVISKGGYIPKGLILYGDPGNGKTLFARVLSDLTNLDFYNIDVSERRFVQKLKNTVQEVKRKETGGIIFIDELDKIFEYESSNSRELTALLQCIDGIETNASDSIIFVATANDYSSLPYSLIRPGRMDKKIELSLPDYESRVDILDYYFKLVDCKIDVSIERIAKLTNNQSCAGLKTLVNECVLESFSNPIDENMIILKNNIILNEKIIGGVTYHDLRITAIEEIAKFIVAKRVSSGSYVLNINNGGSSSGRLFITDNEIYDSDDDYDDYDEDDDESDEMCDGQEIYSKDELESLIMIKLAPTIFTEIIDGKQYTSSQKYFEEVIDLVDNMINNGFYGIENIYCNSVYSTKKYRTKEFFERRENLIYGIIDKLKEETKRILFEDKYIYDLLNEPLMNKKILEANEVEQLLLEKNNA